MRPSTLSSLRRILELGDGVAKNSSSSSSSSSSSLLCEISGGGIMDKTRLKEDGAKMQQEPGKCELWLPRKRRFCASHALPGLQYVPFLSFAI